MRVLHIVNVFLSQISNIFDSYKDIGKVFAVTEFESVVKIELAVFYE